MKTYILSESESNRFWKNVDKNNSDCWTWTAYKDGGRGKFKCDDKTSRSAHSLSFMMVGGVIPKGRFVYQKCKNRDCVKPDHLYVDGIHKRSGYTRSDKTPENIRFWNSVDKDGPIHPVLLTPCWLWLGSLNKGYGGIMCDDGHRRRAHVWSYIQVNGPVREGFQINHKCNNRRCVNPDHLYEGTQQQNMEDAVRAGTIPQGENNQFAKLTDADAKKILEDPRTHELISAEYGISQAVISDIKLRKIWKHIDGEPCVKPCGRRLSPKSPKKQCETCGKTFHKWSIHFKQCATGQTRWHRKQRELAAKMAEKSDDAVDNVSNNAIIPTDDNECGQGWSPLSLSFSCIGG